tara:strand:- start:676 stop:1164 length:489 start_codon:yes stop_codon:yes gene_type:complete
MDNNSIDKNNLNNYSIGINLFKWLLSNLTKDSTILEFGSGYGSLEMSKCFNVYSVEQDREWINKFKDVNYIFSPIDLQTKFYESSFLSLVPDHYDCIILDGPAGHGREGIFQYLNDLNTNVPIVVDDTHRLNEANFAIQLASHLKKKILYMPEFDKSSAILL